MKKEAIEAYREILREATKDISKEDINKIVSVSNRIVKLERKNMAIKIITEKCIVNGKRYRVIVSMEGVLSRDKLPIEYLIGDLPAFYYNGTYGINPDHRIRRTYLLKCKNDEPLLEAKVYPENEFQQILSYIRKAGCNLKRINQKLKLEQWKGREEFII